MTTLLEAAQQALEALEYGQHTLTQISENQWESRGQLAITALKAALAEPDYWEEEARRYASNADYWRKRCVSCGGALPATGQDDRTGECVCGEPTALNTVHRTDGPCYVAEPVQEPVACEPQYANDDGWCEWVCPQPRGYLMQCCDCGLIHEVDSRVAKYQPRPSKEFEVVDDPDLQVQWRMKRRDDISPKRKPLTEDEIALIVADCSASAHRHDDFNFARAIERAHGIGGQP